MMDTYTDEHGYRRFSDSDKLVHRWVAYKYLYDPAHYSDPFSYYQIHHIDGNKLNNDMDNLEILTPIEHESIHGIGHDTYDITEYDSYDMIEYYAESKIFIYGAIFWILTIPITGAIGVLFAIICAVLHWWKKNSE
jgi:hypothetical protein